MYQAVVTTKGHVMLYLQAAVPLQETTCVIIFSFCYIMCRLLVRFLMIRQGAVPDLLMSVDHKVVVP